MDLDGDGQRDVISGSWPGALYMFKGDANKGFAAAVMLKDKEGTDLMVGKASVVHAADWDRDGDLDLVVGCIDGYVWLIPNESGSKELKFGAAVKLECPDGTIHEHHSAPVLADWDSNGTLDLIVGQGDGNVVLYANASRAGAPNLAASQLLFQSSRKMDGSTCGQRVKPCVTDWNADGHLDLLVGDFSMGEPKKRDLTPEQQATLEKLQAEQMSLSQKMQPIRMEVVAQVLEDMGLASGEEAEMRKVFEGMSEAERLEFNAKIQKAFTDHTGLQEIDQKMRDLSAQVQPLQPPSPVQGNVWVMLRAAPTTATLR